MRFIQQFSANVVCHRSEHHIWCLLRQFRYLQQLQFLVFTTLAAGLGKSWQRWLCGALIAMSLYGIAVTEPGPPAGRVWEYRPYSYASLSAREMTACYRGREKFASLLSWIESEPPRNAALLNEPFLVAYDFGPVVEDSAVIFPAGNPDFSRGLGSFLATADAPPALLEAEARRVDEKTRPAFWRGVADGMEAFNVPPAIFSRLPPEWLAFHRSLQGNVRRCFSGMPITPATEEWAVKGQGAAIADCGVTAAGVQKKTILVAQGQSEEFRRWFAWGLGWRLRLIHLPDPLVSLDRLHLLPPWAWRQAEAGALRCEQDLGLPQEESILPLPAKR